jgi:plastocyanin
MFTPRRAALPFAACLALALASCGGNDSSSSSKASSNPATTASPSSSTTAAAGASGGQTVKLDADPNGGLAFVPSKLTAKAGKVTLDMTNPSSSGLSHGVAIEGHGVDKDGKIVAAGGHSTVTVDLKPGTYEFYCPIPAHKAAGMEGKITVS